MSTFTLLTLPVETLQTILSYFEIEIIILTGFQLYVDLQKTHPRTIAPVVRHLFKRGLQKSQAIRFYQHPLDFVGLPAGLTFLENPYISPHSKLLDFAESVGEKLMSEYEVPDDEHIEFRKQAVFWMKCVGVMFKKMPGVKRIENKRSFVNATNTSCWVIGENSIYKLGEIIFSDRVEHASLQEGGSKKAFELEPFDMYLGLGGMFEHIRGFGMRSRDGVKLIMDVNEEWSSEYVVDVLN